MASQVQSRLQTILDENETALAECVIKLQNTCNDSAERKYLEDYQHSLAKRVFLLRNELALTTTLSNLVPFVRQKYKKQRVKTSPIKVMPSESGSKPYSRTIEKVRNAQLRNASREQSEEIERRRKHFQKTQVLSQRLEERKERKKKVEKQKLALKVKTMRERSARRSKRADEANCNHMPRQRSVKPENPKFKLKREYYTDCLERPVTGFYA